jgi:hypothetical protein
MTHRSHRDDHGDRGGSQIPDSDPIVRPRPSCAVEPSRRHHVSGFHAGHGCGNDRDRGTPRDVAPPTPPGIRVRTTAVRPVEPSRSLKRGQPERIKVGTG